MDRTRRIWPLCSLKSSLALALSLALGLSLGFVAVSADAEAAAPPDRVPLELLMGKEPVASPATPSAPPAVPGVLEDLLVEVVPMATVCTEMCPGDPARGIGPYTLNCSIYCDACFGNGEICAFSCDGRLVQCFPGGCGGIPNC